MQNKFHNKYRIPSNRFKRWNYANSGHYFITIVTLGRQNLFGEIMDGSMILNNIGKIVQDEFFKSFEMRQELFLGEHVIMPNHVHAIITLENGGMGMAVETHGHVETHGRASLPPHIANRNRFRRLWRDANVIFGDIFAHN